MPKYDINVNLSEIDGNAFSIMGAVIKELKRHGVDRKELGAYYTEATAGDYNQLLVTTMEWVKVD
jgi:hypothetical protein